MGEVNEVKSLVTLALEDEDGADPNVEEEDGSWPSNNKELAPVPAET